MHTPDPDLPEEHPGNQLRMKLNGTPVRQPDSFAAVMDTARKNGIAGQTDAEALQIVELFFVARQIDMGPPGEVERITSR